MAAMLMSRANGANGPLSFTFIQPIAEPVEDAALFASGHQTNGAALHRRAIVDVVFKNEDLQGERRGINPFCSDEHTCWQVKVVTPRKEVLLIYDKTVNPGDQNWTWMLSFADLQGFWR